MSEKRDNITTKLHTLGLSEDESLVYLTLVEDRGDTALTISRTTNIKRTKIYRLLDSLVAKKLIITRAGERGLCYLISPIDQLEMMVTEQEQKLIQLRQTLPQLQSELAKLMNREQDKTKVLYYHGIDGLKQATYNSLRAKGELLTYEIETMSAFLDRGWAEDVRQKFVDRGVYIRTLTNATKIEAWTDLTVMVEKHWEMRHLDPKGNPFQFEILIYNDVYCMYRYTGNDIFCVEIHSQELADMQRQLFEYLWVGAKKFKILDEHGAAELT